MALLNLDFSPTSPPQPQALLKPSLLIFRLIAGQEIFFPKFIFQRLTYVSHQEFGNRCPSKENLFGQSALLMNANYIVFSLR